MALTASTMLPLGTPAPDFALPEPLSGRTRHLTELRSELATVVMFLCNHCPYVKHVNPALVALAQDYQPRGVSFVAISSNDVATYPQDGPEAMAEVARTLGYPFPYLYDASQTVARAYGAACTPDFFVFDGRAALAYRGRLDATRPGGGAAPDGRELRAALDALIEQRPVDPDQQPSLGCNIKFRRAAD